MLPELSAAAAEETSRAGEAPKDVASPAQNVDRTSPIKPTKSGLASNAGYMALQRKETRLRDDQVDALTAATRELNRAKTGTGERITDNTLIRVAVDLLLSEGHRLQGASEKEIRSSVGL